MHAIKDESVPCVTALIVDDSKMIRVTAKKILLKAGYEVVLATDGLDALSKIVEYQPDLIIMDIMMPEIDGYETCTLIKQHREYKRIPVIMLSGNQDKSESAQVESAGFDLCLAKPFKADGLLNAIDSVLEKTKYFK
ncbi:MAG: response regulator [Pseudomonadales bacterium]|nr:response regulator [Pseudomonadales bacterium]